MPRYGVEDAPPGHRDQRGAEPVEPDPVARFGLQAFGRRPFVPVVIGK